MIARILQYMANLLTLSYTENNAIHGHSVSRYHYAIRLIDEGSNESLIKAYAWLSMAAEEKDMEKQASELKHKIHFELKNRGIYDEAKQLEADYYSKYSPEALRRQIENSYRPFDIMLRVLIFLIDKIVANVDCLDTHLFKKKGSSLTWGTIGVCTGILELAIL